PSARELRGGFNIAGIVDGDLRPAWSDRSLGRAGIPTLNLSPVCPGDRPRPGFRQRDNPEKTQSDQKRPTSTWSPSQGKNAHGESFLCSNLTHPLEMHHSRAKPMPRMTVREGLDWTEFSPWCSARSDGAKSSSPFRTGRGMARQQ